jgi:Lrp/AsnC family transcriptional regulator for asnA, asnC and gidA
MIKTEKIDEIDAKILKELLGDGRKEFIEIAREAKVSKDIIWQHYTNLKKKGVIVGSTIQLDYGSLGYNGAASFFVDVPPQYLSDVVQQMKRIPGIYDVYLWGSHSRLWAVSDFMKADQVDQVKLLIKGIPSVIRLQVEIWADIRNMPENLSILDELCGVSRERMAKDANLSKSGNIDSIDRQLIEKLKANGRAPFNGIGKELGISTSTVIRRYNALKSCRIIRTLIQINPMKIGYFSEACFKLTINSEANIATISDDICGIPDITAFIKTIGTYDFTIFAQIKSWEHFFALEAEIANVSGVNQIDTAALNQFPVLPYPGEHISTF